MQQLKTLDFSVRFIAHHLHLKRIKKNDPVRYVSKSREYGKWTKEYMTDLGPTFIKLGQVLSTRNDLLSAEFIEEIEGLQDDVLPIPYDDIRDNVTIGNIDSVSSQVFKSASIGQIHMAVLDNGNRAVCKFLRPNVRERMENDLKLFNVFFDISSKFVNNSEFKMLQESVKRMIDETDYLIERENGERFYKTMKPLNYVIVPRVSEKLSNENLIVMEYVNGIKITDVETIDKYKIDKQELVKNLIRSYIHQVMKVGYFHADPHPGNISVSPSGKLIFYDFGLMVELNTELKSVLSELIVHMNNKDVKQIVGLLVRNKLIIPTTNIEYVEEFFAILVEYFGDADMDALYNKMLDSGIRKEMGGDVPFQLPLEVLYVIKTFVTIEGICTTLDPEFNYSKYLDSLAGEFISENVDMGSITTNILQIPIQIQSISQSMYDVEKSKSAMMSKMKKTNKRMKKSQYSMVCALLAQSLFESGHGKLSSVPAILAVYFIMF